MGGGKIDVGADFRDLLPAFVDHDVRFLIVGAYALAVLGRPRATEEVMYDAPSNGVLGEATAHRLTPITDRACWGPGPRNGRPVGFALPRPEQLRVEA